MTRNSWFAMTGLCILLATSAVQAHPITLDAEGPRTTMFCWQKGDGEAFTSSSAGSTGGNCLRQKRMGREATLEGTTGFVQLDATQVTNSPWAWAFDTTGGPLSLTPVFTISHSQAQQLLRQISAARNIGRISITGNNGHSIVNGIRHNTAATPTTNVPEPETLALMMMGLIGAAVATRARPRRNAKPSSLNAVARHASHTPCP